MGNDMLWKIDPHTEAKHAILKRYLGGWLGKIGNAYPDLLYVDGFSGPGEYTDGEPGSPIVFLSLVDEMLRNNTMKKATVYAAFNDIDVPTLQHLKEQVENRFSNLLSNPRVHVAFLNKDFEELFDELISRFPESGNFPALIFIDPFGYKKLKMESLRKFMKNPHVELLITLMDSYFRFETGNESARKTLREVFGADDFQGITDQVQLAHMFGANIVKDFKNGHFLTFQMLNSTNRGLYHLVFVTRHPEGVAVMKDAMWSVDTSGSFRYYDRYSDIVSLSNFSRDYWVHDAVKAVQKRFAGKDVYVSEVKDFVLFETLFRPLMKTILDPLVKNGKVTVYAEMPDEDIRKGSYHLHYRLRFA